MTKRKDPSRLQFPGRGHAGNTFHTVEQPGLSCTFYLSGDDVVTIKAALVVRGIEPTNAAIREQSRSWFREMMRLSRIS